MGGKNKARAWAGGILALLACVLPALAGAADIGFAASPNDPAVTKVLGPALGSLFTDGASGGAGGGDAGLGGLFGQLNAAAMLLGAIITAYTMLAGTMSTAHDGAMLGKRWSSMWIPIRVAFGTAMIIPLNGGYCAAQMLVGWLIMNGVGLASSGWQTYADKVLAPSETIVAPIAATAPGMAKDILKNLTCVALAQRFAAASDTSSLVGGTVDMSGEITASGGVRYYGYVGAGGSRQACGKAEFPGVAGVDTMSKDIQTQVAQAHVTALTRLEQDLWPIAVAAATPNSAMTNGAELMHNATASYIKGISAAASAAVGSGSSYSGQMKAMNQQGFIYAGFRYISTMTAANSLAGAATATPSVTSPDTTGNADLAGAIAKAEGSVKSTPDSRSMWQKVKDGVNGAVDSAVETATKVADTVSAAANAAASLNIKQIISDMGYSLVERMIAASNSEGSNPYVASINFGHSIMGWVEFLVVSLGIISVVVGPFAAGLWTSPVGILVTALFGAAFASGATLAMLPVVPMMAWISFILGWLIMCIEALAAAPLWMVAHLNPESEGFTGKGSDGYLILAGLILRPILGLIGLATAFTIGTVGCQLLDTAFLPLMKSASAGSLVGVGMAVIMIMTYVGLKTKILIESMRAINAVPDAIMRWIGGGAASGAVVGVGGAMAEGSHGHGRDAVGAMTGAMSASQGGSWLKGAAERLHGGKKGGDVNERKGGELPDDPSPPGGGAKPEGGPRGNPSGDPKGTSSLNGGAERFGAPGGEGQSGGAETGGKAGPEASKEEGGAGQGGKADNSAEVAKLDQGMERDNANKGRFAHLMPKDAAADEGGAGSEPPAAGSAQRGGAAGTGKAPADDDAATRPDGKGD